MRFGTDRTGPGKDSGGGTQSAQRRLLEKIGGLPEASTHASYLAMDALAALLKEL